MSARVHQVSRSRVFAAPRSWLWGLAADTDRWDRTAGLTVGRYGWEEVDGQWQRVARAREMGFDIAWIEPPYQWVEGRYVRGERWFLQGPVERGGIEVRLEDAEGGTGVTARFFVAPRGILSPVLRAIMGFRFRRALAVYFDALAQSVAHADEVEGDAPPVVQVRRLLVQTPASEISGPRSATDEETLQHRWHALREQGVDAAIADRLFELLRGQPDEELTQIRPFELARVWDADRREVLRTFLYATRVGLTDLRWQINCPVCRVAADTTERLHEVGPKVHCEACRIDYELDFADHVEAVFQPNPAIRQVEAQVYCASSPAFRPHVFTQLCVGARQRHLEPADLPRGTLRIRRVDGRQRAEIEVGPHPSAVRIEVGDEELYARAEPASQDTLDVRSRTGATALLSIERTGWAAETAVGSVVASLPEFLDLFSTEAPAAGVELSVSHVALLFTDLTGSTALYQHIGDADAFATVQEHFRLMERIADEHGGAVVKTIGDAVMASFPSAVRAVRAALAMVPENEARFGHLGLGVRVGVHAGPCLAVRANACFDYFGTTVNLASRLESEAGRNRVVMTEALASNPEMRTLLQAYEHETFSAHLKGIAEEQRLVAIAGALRDGAG